VRIQGNVDKWKSREVPPKAIYMVYCPHCKYNAYKYIAVNCCPVCQGKVQRKKVQ